MLVLSRKQNEVICIGRNIDVVVVRVLGNRVRLGIKAPSDVPVDRQEIYESKRESRRGAHTPDRCVSCSCELSTSELEIGTGRCHRCGHEHYAARTESYRRTVKSLREKLGEEVNVMQPAEKQP